MQQGNDSPILDAGRVGGHFWAPADRIVRLAIPYNTTIAIAADSVEPKGSVGYWTWNRWASAVGPEGLPGSAVAGSYNPSAPMGALLGAFCHDLTGEGMTLDQVIRTYLMNNFIIGQGKIISTPSEGKLWLFMNAVNDSGKDGSVFAMLVTETAGL